MNYRKEWYYIETLRCIWYQKAPVEIVTDRFPGLEPFERNIRTLITPAWQDGTFGHPHNAAENRQGNPRMEKRQENTDG
ncbi:MAG: hypothetical protein HY881_26480 [Deltaproteobacteria bacterium]|nr:hypothetical protein [Deltaproteobacteria bacterium]